MKIGIIGFTPSGYAVGEAIRRGLIEDNQEVWLYTKGEYIRGQKAIALMESLGAWTRRMFEEADAIIFVGACGIAVRSIAPFVKDKKTDPAVLVVDEKGTFCISLLSGHIGGANELCHQVSQMIQAVEVVTTATDLNGKFAVDVFAKKNHLHISNMAFAKEVAAALVAGKEITLVDESIKGKYEKKSQNGIRIISADKTFKKPDVCPVGIYAGISRRELCFGHTLYLTPQVVTLGIGCRKNTPMEQIQKMVEQAVLSLGISFKSIKQAATIDLKKEEPGLLAYCEKYQLPLITYGAEELRNVQGEFSSSNFVSSITGVDNVCERSAVLASNNGTLIQKKIAAQGVTVALAVEDWSLNYE